MIELRLTKDMLYRLEHALRQGIESHGNPDAYFAATDRIGWVLGADGWQLRRGPRVETSDLTAITDRDLHERLQSGDIVDCIIEILTDGIWIPEYACGAQPRELPRIRDEHWDDSEPGQESDPQVVCATFESGGERLWPETHWFDRAASTPVLRWAHHCQHHFGRTTPMDEHRDRIRELDLTFWRTPSRRWVAQIHNPSHLNEAFGETETVWASASEQFVAHAVYCSGRAALTPPALEVPLVRAVLAAQSVIDELVLPASGMEFHGPENYYGPRRRDEVWAIRTLLAGALDANPDRLWGAAGTVLESRAKLNRYHFSPHRLDRRPPWFVGDAWDHVADPI